MVDRICVGMVSCFGKNRAEFPVRGIMGDFRGIH